MIGQHDAAGADADGLGAARDMADHHAGGGAGDAGHVVMLRHPIAAIAPGFRMARQIQAVLQRQRRVAALDDGRKIENRKGNG